MYLSGTLTIDPSQLTHIRRVAPTKAFKRMLHLMTAGAVSERAEEETFCAIVILQQLNRVLRSLGITNIVRLAKDGVDFYFDEEGREDDLKEAMDEFALEVDSVEAEVFESLTLVLEHRDEFFNSLLEVRVRRVHRVGEHPIEIKVNSLLVELESAAASPGTRPPIFAEQGAYDAFVAETRARFDTFLERIEMEVRKLMEVDGVEFEPVLKIVRPKAAPGDKETPKGLGKAAADPVFYGYPGYQDPAAYLLWWSLWCHDANVHCSSFHLVDEGGAGIAEIGEAGIDAGEGTLLDPSSEFVPEAAEGVAYLEGSGFDAAIAEAGTERTADVGAGDSSGGWSFADLFSGGDGGDGGGGDGGSSCGSSCGGGCGGCGS